MVVNKIIVMQRLENGDENTVSVKAKDRPFTEKDRDYLEQNLLKLVQYIEDTLYFTIRTTINNSKDNWKCKNISEVQGILDEIFKDVAGVDE